MLTANAIKLYHKKLIFTIKITSGQSDPKCRGQESLAKGKVYVPPLSWYNIYVKYIYRKGLFTMKILLKILAVPFVPALAILSLAMKFFAWLSVRIFTLIALIIAIGGVGLLVKGDTGAGVGVLVMAFLVSPFGIPLIAEAIAGLIDGINDSLKGFITT